MKKTITLSSHFLFISALIFTLISVFPSLLQGKFHHIDEFNRVTTCNIDVIGGEENVTINDLNAPHAIVKLFNPNWSINFECFDNCNPTEIITELSAGIYHVSIKLYDANWQLTCSQLQDVEVTSDNGGGENCNVSWTATNSSITIEGASAPHVILKLFNPNWSTNFDCFDNCAAPLIITGLTAEMTYHLSYKLYDSSWQLICEDLIDITTNDAGGGGDECGFIQEDIVITNRETTSCTTNEIDDNYLVTCRTSFTGNYIKVETTINQDGDITEVEEVGFTPSYNSFLDAVILSDSILQVQCLAPITYSVKWRTDIDLGFSLPNLQNVSLISQAKRIVYDGALFVGTIAYDDVSNGTNSVFKFTIKFDEDGNVENTNILPSNAFGDLNFFFGSSLYSNSDGYVFNMTESNRLSFIKFDEAGNFLWKTSFASDLPSNDFKQAILSLDEQYIYAVNVNNLSAIVDKIDINTGQKSYKLEVGSQLIPSGAFQEIEAIVPLSGGGFFTGFTYLDPATNEEGYTFGRIDENGSKIWDNTLSTTTNFIPQIQTSDGGFFFVAEKQTTNNASSTLSYFKTTLDGMLTPACSGLGTEVTPLPCDLGYRYTADNLEIEGAGLHAPHVIIKVFDSNWSTVFTCFDNCDNQINISGLLEGTYHVSIKLYDEDWQKTCEELVDIDLNSQSQLAVDPDQELLVFNALKKGREVDIHWVVNNSRETTRFVIERSADGKLFHEVGRITPFEENSSEMRYQLLDQQPIQGMNYYRMKQFLADDQVRYSVIKSVVFNLDLEAVTIFPNPTKNAFFLNLSPYEGEVATIRIINHLGQTLQSHNREAITSRPLHFSIADFKSGLYQIVIKISDQKIVTRTLVVIRVE